MFVFYLYIIIYTKIFCEFSIVLLSSNNVSCTNSYFSFTNRLSLVFYSFLWVNAAVHCLITGSLNIKRLFCPVLSSEGSYEMFLWKKNGFRFFEALWIVQKNVSKTSCCSWKTFKNFVLFCAILGIVSKFCF